MITEFTRYKMKLFAKELKIIRENLERIQYFLSEIEALPETNKKTVQPTKPEQGQQNKTKGVLYDINRKKE